MLAVEAVPHDWLFPQVAAVVHHGGAGTTAAGLRAGVPAVVVPAMADQPYWGRRLHELGAAPAPIPRHRLTAPKLAAAIRGAVMDPGLRSNAVRLGKLIGGEDGLGAAVRIIRATVGA
jgi:UDP:flavonoid glycosyltransferase YjiC (YdhE family)